MINTFDFRLVTPNKVVLDKKIIGITLGTTAGQIGILYGHEALVGTVVPSKVTIFDSNGIKTEWVVGDGSVSVAKNKVQVNVDFVQEHTSNINPKEIKEKILRNVSIFGGSTNDISYDKIAIQLEDEISKLSKH